MELPTLRTERLILRAYTLADVPALVERINDVEVARTTLNLPHPYTPEIAVEWIGGHAKRFAEGKDLTWAVTLAADGELAGGIGLSISPRHRKGTMGYWVARRHWGQGICTEAAGAVVAYAFDALKLNRVEACHFSHNPASGRVMQKIGMRHEGHFRQCYERWGELVDSDHYAILASDRR